MFGLFLVLQNFFWQIVSAVHSAANAKVEKKTVDVLFSFLILLSLLYKFIANTTNITCKSTFCVLPIRF